MLKFLIPLYFNDASASMNIVSSQYLNEGQVAENLGNLCCPDIVLSMLFYTLSTNPMSDHFDRALSSDLEFIETNSSRSESRSGQLVEAMHTLAI
jgi:hypothetical protein